MLSAILVFLAAPAVLQTPPPPRAHSCMPQGITYARKGRRGSRPQKLGDEPPARQYLAVVRHVGGCPEPAVVRSGIGGR
jgi:hypothetical protein